MIIAITTLDGEVHLFNNTNIATVDISTNSGYSVQKGGNDKDAYLMRILPSLTGTGVSGDSAIFDIARIPLK